MVTVFDLQKIFEQTWGYIGLPFPEIVIKTALGGKDNYTASGFKFPALFEKNKTSYKGVDFYAKNNLGREVFMPIWLFETDNPLQEEKYLLPNTVMNITCKKNIVVTPLVNRAGTVKEEINIDDWEINVKGVIVSKDNSYPDTQVQILDSWFKADIALNIENARTAISLGEGEKVVITALSFPEIRGFENTQPYEIKMISDTQFDLTIK